MNTTPQIEAFADETPGLKPKTWKMDNESDFKEISEHFLLQPEYRIMEFVEKYWIQKIHANAKAEYASLDETFMYESLTHPMISNGFTSLNEAKMYFRKFANQTKEIIHPLTKGEDY